ASKTDKPVIGVPVSAKLGGLDALLSIVQMPPRVPVACVGIDRGENAAYLAIKILNLIKK
ncbi:MAG: AIR carboxylase family protein, partial [Candidatus Lokiarchaeota archaeon]|nr:AIR carboxylase family protein [Candidatus Lokiarchaeota archaeon]